VNVTGVSNASTPNQNGVQSGFKQLVQNFKALESALQSNDLSSAQQAFAAFQQDIQNLTQETQPAQALGQNTQLGKDFQALQSALQSNNLTAAKQAFATLQQDMQTTRAGHAHHAHHHHQAASGSNDGVSDDGVQSTSTTSNTSASSQSDGVTLDQQA